MGMLWVQSRWTRRLEIRRARKLGSSEHDSKHNSEFSPQEESIGGTKFDGKHDLKGNKGSAALFDVDSLDQFGE